MRDPKRIRRILGHIHRIWEKYPDMRFGQLYENLLSQYAIDRGMQPKTVITTMYNFEDADFEAFLYNFEEF